MENQKSKNSLVMLFIIIIIAAVGLYFISKGGFKKETMEPSQNQISGLEITTLKEGSGIQAKAGDIVSVNYTGTFEDGEAFDSNIDPAFGHVAPFIFTLGQGMVILGWDQGVLGMKIGEKRKLVIDSSLAYGDSGIPGAIPPKANLIFEVELLKIGQ